MFEDQRPRSNVSPRNAEFDDRRHELKVAVYRYAETYWINILWKFKYKSASSAGDSLPGSRTRGIDIQNTRR